MTSFKGNLLFIGVLLYIVVESSWCYKFSYKTHYDYVLADLQRCHTVAPDIIIWVQGRAASSHQRSVIRALYGNNANWPDGVTALVLFFVGLPKRRNSAKVQSLINYEYEQYRDIIQNNYLEDYRNQTCKMVSAINYIAHYCPNASLVIRIDDDVLLHPNLLPLLAEKADEENSTKSKYSAIGDFPSNSVMCRLISDFGVWRRRDHPKHFNAVDDTVLPGETMYPPFCAGFFIAMSGNVPSLLQNQLNNSTPFWMDDRYMGVLQKYAHTNNIDITDVLDFGYSSITARNIGLFNVNKTLARHMPGNLKHHVLDLYYYVSDTVNGLKGYFNRIKYKKKK